MDIHSAQNNMGGDLTADETSVIRGALDLASKIARTECTPLDKARLVQLSVHHYHPPKYSHPLCSSHFVGAIVCFTAVLDVGAVGLHAVR